MYVHTLIIDDNCFIDHVRWRNYELAIIAGTIGPRKMKILTPCALSLCKPLFAKAHHPRSPLVMKVRSRSSSVISGASTPGGGTFKSLSERDLQRADAALSQVNGITK